MYMPSQHKIVITNNRELKKPKTENVQNMALAALTLEKVYCRLYKHNNKHCTFQRDKLRKVFFIRFNYND